MLSRFWKVILSNVDTTLAIGLSIVAAVLSVFGGSQTALFAAMAGVLALLAYSIIRDRLVRDSLETRIALWEKALSGKEQASVDTFFRTDLSESSLIPQAKQTIWLLQETGSKVIEENLKPLASALGQGVNVKLIVPAHDPIIVDFIAFRNRNLDTAAIVSRQKDAQSKINSLIRTAQGTSGELEVRHIRYPLDFTGVLIDPESPDLGHRVGLMRTVGFQSYFDDKRGLSLSFAREPETFSYFARQISEMWSKSEVFDGMSAKEIER